ncbi:synaptonemal complex protein 2-like [Sigmodon hispidus]
MILTVGDYSQQVALSEALCRMAAGTLRNELAPQWFDDAILAEAFKEIKNREFETDCRRFLNFLNNRLGDERRVYSFPCLAAFAEDQEMRKPTDEKLEEFWIDFNLGSQSVTFYIDNREEFSLWEPVQLLKEAVVKYIIVENDRMKLFIVYLREPIIISRKERKTIEIYFDRQFGISQASAQALGEDKETRAYTGDKTLVLINISPGLDKEDGEISSSHKRETEHVEESTILPESVDAEDNGCPITGSFNVQSESAIAFIPQDFGKSLTLRAFPQYLASGLPMTLLEFKFHVKQHFFESNEDSASSERSWTQNSKRKSLRTYSQRRKLKVRSLRILPLSPVSSGRAPEKDQAEITPEWKDISRQNNTILPNFSEAKLQGSSVLLTPEVSTQKIDSQGRTDLSTIPSTPHPLLIRGRARNQMSRLEHPKVEESIPQIMNRESLMENSSFKHKLEHSEHRGIPDESTTALKQSRLEDTPGSSAVSVSQCELQEIKRPFIALVLRGLGWNEHLKDDVSISSQEDMPENANSSALKMALENFTSDLKRKFEKYNIFHLKQKEIPLCSEKAKEVPGCLIRLWKQMYMCRLDKLQRFHSYVLWELSNLEKDLQAFECLEDDAQEFWKQQPADLQLFHDQQTLRFNSTQSSKESQSLAL